MKKTLSLVTLIISLTNCSKNQKAAEKTVEPATNKVTVTSDSCSYCSMAPFLIKPSVLSPKTKIVIDYPVAIEFFNQANFIFKYDRKGGSDTLIKFLNIKQPGDRSDIYRLTEQHFHYTQDIKPSLLKRSIPIINILSNERFITVTNHKETYILNLIAYKKMDGVLMYKPGKKPIFWIMNIEDKNCYDYYGIVSWYFGCQ